MTKIHEYKELRLRLTGALHELTFDGEDYIWRRDSDGVHVMDQLTSYFYPLANIVEYKVVTSLYTDDGTRVYNREGVK